MCSSHQPTAGADSAAIRGDRRATSRRRYELIGGPGGYLSIVPAGSPMRRDQYRHWVTLLRVSLPRRMGPLSVAGAGQLKTWALLAYELRP